jgi:adenine-specific DNA-methyltransferase
LARWPVPFHGIAARPSKDRRLPKRPEGERSKWKNRCLAHLTLFTLTSSPMAENEARNQQVHRLVSASGALLDTVEMLRLDASRKLDADRKIELGQFLTPAPIARHMAAMLRNSGPVLTLLDPGAGIGSLSAAWIAAVCEGEHRPERVSIVAFEIEPRFIEYLHSTLELSRDACRKAGIEMDWQVRQEDFILAAVKGMRTPLFSKPEFTTAILNPPYRKIRSDSQSRNLLRKAGIETGNLYSAFLALTIGLLRDGGEFVAISPRSFCNGPYFREFRRWLLQRVRLRGIHIFETRDSAFREDEVLQENVIISAVKSLDDDLPVTISSGSSPDDEHPTIRELSHAEVVHTNDPDAFIHIVPDELGDRVAARMRFFATTLSELGLEVSTGRVVDFRARAHLRTDILRNTVPLIYPAHIREGFVVWPLEPTRKPQAIVECRDTEDLLIPGGWYAILKRFSAKEEKRRIVAGVYDPSAARASKIGFENHLNYFHHEGGGLSESLAKGLTVFLNSRLVDLYFRQFSGHTQVNATDLRRLRYPSLESLERLGRHVDRVMPDQDAIDALIEEEMKDMSGMAKNPIQAQKKLEDSFAILKALGLPRGQQNERSALTLLALLGLTPEMTWQQAGSPMMGITPIMDFVAEHYGKKYKPNTRESVRRFTIHQFLDAALVVLNPDKPSRAINSADTVYQIEPGALALVRSFGTTNWEANLREYLISVKTLAMRYAREREIEKIPLNVAPGKAIMLSPGGQNPLIKKIVDAFCPRFTPGAKVIYVGDTDTKWGYFEEEEARRLDLHFDPHGKMPDVVVYYEAEGWLVLIEAVTSHGPVNPKRRGELEQLFRGCKRGLVYVTAFLDRSSLTRFLNDISWETEVWVADAPTHLIHFNGERFLGPY